MSLLNPDRTVGELVTECPARSRVFEGFHIGFCCCGRQALGAACEAAGVEIDRVVEALNAAAADRIREDDRNWAEADSTELIEHILSAHHDHLRQELPRLLGLVDKVTDVHGAKHPELAEVQSTYAALADELEQHMLKEEQVLFPAMVESGRDSGCSGSLAGPIQVMGQEHDAAGQALAKLWELTDGYKPPEDACNTFRAMLDGLDELERDLHLHIHKENNILFPRFAASA